MRQLSLLTPDTADHAHLAGLMPAVRAAIRRAARADEGEGRKALPDSTPDASDHTHLAGLMPAVRAAMRRAAGADEGEGRKALPDSINSIATSGGVRLTTGNSKAITKDILDKWLSPSDTSHPPSLLAIVVFCLATRDVSPLKLVLKTVGLHIATDEEMRDAAYGRACRLEREVKKMKRRLEEDL